MDQPPAGFLVESEGAFGMAEFDRPSTTWNLVVIKRVCNVGIIGVVVDSRQSVSDGVILQRQVFRRQRKFGPIRVHVEITDAAPNQRIGMFLEMR